jgi:ubiquitin carboxyl-terminal hydrolase 25
LVHDGDAESGHYYTFIFDRASNKWWRLNDFQASEETEETVMRESFGKCDKDSKKAAYSLFYVSETITKEQAMLSPHRWGNEKIENL